MGSRALAGKTTTKSAKEKIDAQGPGARAKRKPVPSETINKAERHIPTAATGFTPYMVFEKCIERAVNITKIHTEAHGGGKSRPQGHLADLHRAAIVLSISALDAFVRTFVIANIRDLLADKTRTLPLDLSFQIRKFLKEDQLLEAARSDDLLDRVEKAFRSHFEKKSFQGTKAITEGFKLIGYPNIFHDVAINSQYNEDNLVKELDAFTERRHAIAHRGDYEMTVNPPVENKAKKKDATDCAKLVKLIAKSINDMRSKK